MNGVVAQEYRIQLFKKNILIKQCLQLKLSRMSFNPDALWS